MEVNERIQTENKEEDDAELSPTKGDIKEDEAKEEKKDEKEKWRNGSNGTRTIVGKQNKKKTVTWADTANENSKKRRVLAKVME